MTDRVVTSVPSKVGSSQLPVSPKRRKTPLLSVIISSSNEPVTFVKTYEYSLPYSKLIHVAGITPQYDTCRIFREGDSWRFLLLYSVVWEDMSKRPKRVREPCFSIPDKAIKKATKDVEKIDPTQMEIELTPKTWRDKVLVFCLGVVSGKIAIEEGDEVVITPPSDSQDGKIEIRKHRPEPDM